MKVKGFQDTIGWYNKNAKKYAQVSESQSNPEQVIEFAALLPKHAKVLDAGCGAGRDTNLLSKKGVNAIGLDISEGLIAVARQQYPNLTFIEGDLRGLPFNNQEFDGVWAHASLLHLETGEDVSKSLSEFARVLKPKGILHVLVKAQTGDEKTAVVSDKLSEHDRFFQYFTRDEVEQLLQEHNFSIVKLEQYREVERVPAGRPEVKWILALARKNL